MRSSPVKVAVLATVALLAAALLLSACGGGKKAASTTGSGKPTCQTIAQPAAKSLTGTKPTAPLPAGKTYEITMSTNCGSFTIKLDPAQSPNAVASFYALAKSGYFDKTIFHRIVPGFVIQGGDPGQTGSGGPGYSTVDTPPATAKYTLGVVAMAKTAAEAPGTAGSQFFIVTVANAGLPADYAIIGTVSAGLPVVNLIGTLGDANEQPTRTVEITSATVSAT